MFVHWMKFNFLYAICNSTEVFTMILLAVIFLCLLYQSQTNSKFMLIMKYSLYFIYLLPILFFLLMNVILIKLGFLYIFSKNHLCYFTYFAGKNSDFTQYLHFMKYSQHMLALGWSLLLLCFFTSFLSLYYLGDSSLFVKGNSVFYFLFFLFCTTIMISSTNLLMIFLSFEFIFFPSLYFVYTLGYVKKVDKTIYFLLAWTLFGSFLVLCALAYIYSQFETLSYLKLLLKNFTSLERNVLYLALFVGFGIKLPIFPFHYWLTKVHVEAPAGFSMFLSGFLVKTAYYCFYILSLMFSSLELNKIVFFWVCVCVVEASMKMWMQVDMKKLVAYATIQEMNMLMLYLLLVQMFNNMIIILFILMHGILSTYMFFLVDQIQKKTQTRNILALSGFGGLYPNTRTWIWLMLLLYLGFPYTMKFVMEWTLASYLLINFGVAGLLIFFGALFFGGVGFVKCWLLIMYGNPSSELTSLKSVDIFSKDNYFAFFVFLLLFILQLLFYLLN